MYKIGRRLEEEDAVIKSLLLYLVIQFVKVLKIGSRGKKRGLLQRR
jgi:hypothetical protein